MRRAEFADRRRRERRKQRLHKRRRAVRRKSFELRRSLRRRLLRGRRHRNDTLPDRRWRYGDRRQFCVRPESVRKRVASDSRIDGQLFDDVRERSLVRL